MSTLVTGSIAGVILAGGKSSRMGCNKALLKFRGARLIDTIATCIQNIGAPVYVSGEIAPYQGIPDVISDRGPLGGIISTVDFLSKQGIQAAIFVPVDMPLMTTQLLLGIMNCQQFADAVYCLHHPLPLLLNFTPQVTDILNTLKTNHQHDASIRELLTRLTTHIYHPDEKKALTNVNTPNDWQQIQEAFSNDEY